MSAWQLLNARNPLWSRLGGLLILSTLAGSALFLYLGPRPLQPRNIGGDLGPGNEGHMGNLVQQLGNSRFVLTFDTIRGDKEDLHLQTVTGRLEEVQTYWLMKAPAARRIHDVLFLDGPLNLEAREPEKSKLLGSGNMENTGPALRWDHGIWTGLGTLEWDDFTGPGKGHWTLPPGWHREMDGRFVVDQGPVHWRASESKVLHALTAESLWTTLGFQEGHLEGVDARLEGGRVTAQSTDMNTTELRWSPPIHFNRDDGWSGEASSGYAPRPEPGMSLEKLELCTFHAQRGTLEGQETLEAEGVRWTSAGLRLEGNVRWIQPLDNQRLVLRSPRVLIREGAGGDLPAQLPIGEAWAEGTAVITWGNRSLSSPRIEAKRKQRFWRILAPCLGRGEQGTFSAGKGEGTPKRWEFDGPIKASFLNNGSLRGDHLTWEGEVWTFTGRPVTWTNLRQRLAGPKVMKRMELIQFPESISGALVAPEGDLTVRADRGEGSSRQIQLEGRVECAGQGWRLKADKIVASLDPGGIIKSILAKGSVSLYGNKGEGRGEALDLDLGSGSHARWLGKVSGIAEVQEMKP